MAYNAVKVNFGFDSSVPSAISAYLGNWSAYPFYNAAYAVVFRQQTGNTTNWTPPSGTSAFCAFWIPASGKTFWIHEKYGSGGQYAYHIVVRRPGLAWASKSFIATSGSTSGVTVVDFNGIGYGTTQQLEQGMFTYVVSGRSEPATSAITFNSAAVTGRYFNGTSKTAYNFWDMLPTSIPVKIYKGGWSGSVYTYDQAMASSSYNRNYDYFYNDTLTYLSSPAYGARLSQNVDRITYQYQGQIGDYGDRIYFTDNAPHCQPGDYIIVCLADDYDSIEDAYNASAEESVQVIGKGTENINGENFGYIDISTQIFEPDAYVFFGKLATSVIVFIDDFYDSSTNGILTGIPSNRYITVGELDAITEPFYNGSNPFYTPRKTPYYSQASGVLGGSLIRSRFAAWGTTFSTDMERLLTNGEMNINSTPNAKDGTAGGYYRIPLSCESEKVAILTGTTTQIASTDGVPSVSPYLTWPSSGATSGNCNVSVNFSGVTNFDRAQVALGLHSGSTGGKLLSYAIWNINTGRTASGTTSVYLHAPVGSVHNKFYYAGPAFANGSVVAYYEAWFRQYKNSAWGPWMSGRTSPASYYASNVRPQIIFYDASNYWTATATLTSKMSGTMPYVNNSGYTVNQCLTGLENLSESGITYSSPTYKETVMSNSVKSSTLTITFTVPKSKTGFTANMQSIPWVGIMDEALYSFTTASTSVSRTITHTLPTELQQDVKLHFHGGDYFGGRTHKFSVSAVCQNVVVMVWEGTFSTSQYAQDYYYYANLPLAYAYLNSTIRFSDHHQVSSSSGFKDATVTSVVPSSYEFNEKAREVVFNLVINPYS